jgi:hypothetical protein
VQLAPWVGPGDELEEVQELGVGVALVAAVGHRAGGDLQGGEQRRRPVALVVVGLLLRDTRPEAAG